MIVKPLYGHTSEDTAYEINDYPYSFKLRCKIRYWLEYNEKKGVRLCSQTTNPKKGDIWNAPKRSTYVLLAGCMYLDENDHIKWVGLHEYTNAEQFLSFVQSFPGIQLTDYQIARLKYWVAGKIAICKTKIDGKAVIKINNVPQLPSEQEIEEAKKELEVWEKTKPFLQQLLPVKL